MKWKNSETQHTSAPSPRPLPVILYMQTSKAVTYKYPKEIAKWTR